MANRKFRSSSYSKGTSKTFNRPLRELRVDDRVVGRPSTTLDLDTDELFLTAFHINTYTKRLRKLQKDINRKRNKPKSKELERCEDDYDENYNDLISSARKLQQILKLEGSGARDSGHGTCTECNKKESRIWKLEQQNRRSSGVDFEQYVLDLSRAENKVHELQKEIDRLKKELKQETTEKEDTLQRLSEIASSKLRDNNPNIADLSDKNRPTKLAEQVGEIYDNEWTDAFDELSDDGLGEREIIGMLLNVFMDIFEECKRVTTDGFFERVQSCIDQTDMLPNSRDDMPIELPQQLRQQIKEFRKHRAGKIIDKITEDIWRRDRLEYLQRSPYTNDNMKLYVTKCIQVSWLMCVQDPPMLLSRSTQLKFNLNLFREYTKRGPYVDYVVWPVMYLHDNGNIICKGVAQGTKEMISTANMSANNQTQADRRRDGFGSSQMQHSLTAQEQKNLNSTLHRQYRGMNQNDPVSVYKQGNSFQKRQVQGQDNGQTRCDDDPVYHRGSVRPNHLYHEDERPLSTQPLPRAHSPFRAREYQNQFTRSSPKSVRQQGHSRGNYPSLYSTYHAGQYEENVYKGNRGQRLSRMQTDF